MVHLAHIASPKTASLSVQPFLYRSPVCQHTDTQTTLCATSVATERTCAMHAMRPKSPNSILSIYCGLVVQLCSITSNLQQIEQVEFVFVVNWMLWMTADRHRFEVNLRGRETKKVNAAVVVDFLRDGVPPEPEVACRLRLRRRRTWLPGQLATTITTVHLATRRHTTALTRHVTPVTSHLTSRLGRDRRRPEKSHVKRHQLCAVERRACFQVMERL